ncbi:MAG TPA: class A beta-lactamase-related serine hydrolase [Thermoplasmatales archaeon]|nr:class A beta-lactamase-related serine hydrolase [Thermoplasmatales archaeon]
MKNTCTGKIYTLFLMLILIISSCLPAVTEAEKTATVENSFFDDAIFNAKVRTMMRIINLPSLVVCVIKNSSVVFTRTYGYYKPYLKQKPSLETIYCIGSISKTVTATALMQLYEKGCFDLDENINNYLPFEIRNPRFPDVNITFRMLLAHQSSLGDTLYDVLIPPLRDNVSQWIKERLVPGERFYRERYWKDYPPGENFSYSSFGFILCSLLVERISGVSFEEYCQENIFMPLDMRDTSFHLQGLDKSRVAKPYYPLFAELYFPLYSYDAKCAAACGGLRTTVVDLSHFLIAHMNGGVWNDTSILNSSTVEIMHSIQYPNVYAPFYGGKIQHGLGWFHLNHSGDLWEGYNGGAFGFAASMMIHESDGIGVIMLSNGHVVRPKTKIGYIVCDIRMTLYDQLGHLFLHGFNTPELCSG